jgi:hypothetical protein
MKTHNQVIEQFITQGRGGRGKYVVAREKDGAVYSDYRRRWEFRPVRETPLAVRLEGGGFLANGARLDWPRNNHQGLTLRALERSQSPFGVVPFDSVTAAWTDGKVRDWDQAPFTLRDLRREIEVVIPSRGEQWREVTTRDKYGREQTRTVHTLGDSVVRVRDHFYLSGVDETGSMWRGLYFLARLITDRPPQSFEEALNLLKPKVVQEAEARGAYVRRQGEWFAIPTKFLTSQLLADVGRGVAVRREKHILGRDGHHQLEEAVIYRFGPRRGEVYGRGVLTHTRQEHSDLELGFRWHRIVHNVQGASYSLAGNFD